MSTDHQAADLVAEAEAVANGHRFLTILLGDLDDPTTTSQLGEFLSRIGYGREITIYHQSKRHITFRIQGLNARLAQGDLIETAHQVNREWRLQESMRPIFENSLDLRNFPAGLSHHVE